MPDQSHCYRQRQQDQRDEPWKAVETMNNTAWENARLKSGLSDLHVHDLRHTVSMRLREVGVSEKTRAAVLWHSNESFTDTTRWQW